MGRIDQRIETIAEHISNVPEIVKIIISLKVPIIAHTQYRVRSDFWQTIYLSNGGMFLAPITNKNESLLVDRLKVTNKQFGIAVTISTISILIEHMMTNKSGEIYTNLFVQLLNRLYYYKEQLHRDKEIINLLLDF